jgi:hypothetical protein
MKAARSAGIGSEDSSMMLVTGSSEDAAGFDAAAEESASTWTEAQPAKASAKTKLDTIAIFFFMKVKPRFLRIEYGIHRLRLQEKPVKK